ncbi:alpha-2-glucosyltransferase Alg10 [Dipodascopsis tothii]|uniref:alpha-2-glucosyltransferase Alg10 n=1 Tax=Dipodascopsis tothii TaxID=44089 RepID=UPI0034CEAC74
MAALYRAATIAVAGAVNRAVPEPYMDEVFHVGQTQTYCAHRFGEWDDKITTPPGLYFLGYIAARAGALLGIGGCTAVTLRAVNLVAAAAVPATLPHSKLFTFTVAMFPLLYFYAFLYYTDLWSNVLVFTAVFSSRARWQRALVLLVSLAFRQTNVVWTAYVAGLVAVDEIDRVWKAAVAAAPAEPPAPPAVPTVTKRGVTVPTGRPAKAPKTRPAPTAVPPEPTVAAAGPADYVRAVGNALRGVQLDPVAVAQALLPFMAVIEAFALFLVWNRGIALGDKANHVAGLHFPQLFYFVAFTMAMAWPVWIGQTAAVARTFVRTRGSVGAAAGTVAALAAVLALVHTNTIAHPFVLADNRHYVFYIWRRVIDRTPWSRYALAPVYVGAGWFVFAYTFYGRRPMHALLFAGATAAVLVPSPLIEFRYYVVPYVLWRDAYERAHPSSSLALKAELVWYAAVGLATVAVFIARPFEWPGAPGLQRFMW